MLSVLAAAILLIGTVKVAAYVVWIRPWHRRWGAAEDEVGAALPGDDLVAQPRISSTRAVEVRAPSRTVWPWLVQIGRDRGGFYSYEWPANLAGCGLSNAERIVPELQELESGDRIGIHPEMPGLPVVEVEPGRYLVLAGRTERPGEGPLDLTGPLPEDYVAVSWCFVLRRTGAETTRLVARLRLDWRPTLKRWIAYRLLLEPIHFVMERKMLLGLKERAERSGHAGSEPVAPRKESEA